ncbi:MAG: arylesterase, partial [Pseudomonadota bacterium]
MLLATVQPAHAEQSACEGTRMVILGDSLVAGYGLPPGAGYPEQLAASLKELGYGVEIVNAGVSGDTSSGGLARLDWSLGDTTDMVMVELGANDALRGIPVEQTRTNLEKIVTSLKEKDIAVLLAGMMAPPNMGETYADEFNAIYGDLARDHDVALYPFFLDGVAAERDLNLDDGIHPNREGISIIVERSLAT